MGIEKSSSNERRIAEDHRDCYWLYVVAGGRRRKEIA